MAKLQKGRVPHNARDVWHAGALALIVVVAGPVRADPAPASKPGSPIVEQIVAEDRPALVVHKHARPVLAHRHHGRGRHIARALPPLDRPALAGVELLAPLEPPAEPPHIVVPLPAYPLDSVVSALTTPPPAIVCHRAPREHGVPDPHLYREVPVICEPDNP